MLILGGISGAGMTAILEDYRPIFMAVTVGLLGTAFYLTYRPRGEGADADKGIGTPPAVRPRSSKMMAINKVMLWGVTVIVVVMLFFPHVITNLIPSSDTFTEDMDLTVIRIEGMT